jgi:hypothetical protein
MLEHPPVERVGSVEELEVEWGCGLPVDLAAGSLSHNATLRIENCHLAWLGVPMGECCGVRGGMNVWMLLDVLGG